ncbi:MAG: hypothetical protein M3126_11295 [Candidatus Eremiobacteraeota bacterium]|nr:hypothetical protein [Candidatus Eremiobacteraeota bacterium]
MTSYRTLLLGAAFVLSAVTPAVADTALARPKAAATMNAPAALSAAQHLQVLVLSLTTGALL